MLPSSHRKKTFLQPYTLFLPRRKRRRISAFQAEEIRATEKGEKEREGGRRKIKIIAPNMKDGGC